MTYQKPTTINYYIRLIAILLVLSCYGPFSWAQDIADEQLREIKNLVVSGAPGLALRIMERQQAGLKAEQARWLIWERQRLEIYASIQAWEKIIEHAKQLPQTLPDEYRHWVMTQQAQALHELKRGKEARLLIRRLLLAIANKPDEQTQHWIKRWRHFIIQSYLADALVDDAYTAIIRFQQDYRGQEKEMFLLRARVLLMSKRPQDAIELLESHRTNAEASMLYLLAQLRSQQQNSVEVIKAGLKQARKKKQDRMIRLAYWGIVAEAAQQANDHRHEVMALEQLLVEKETLSLAGLFAVNVDTLWQAYVDYALLLGNRAQLLIGDDAAWLGEAAKHKDKSPRLARAYYALLLQQANTEENRQLALKAFVSLLKKKRDGERLLEVLFTRSQQYSSMAEIPERVRHELVDIALARQDIPRASAVMATLDEPPPGNTSYMWYLRRARILVLGGQAQKGAEVLSHFLKNNAELTRTQIDRLLQVVFDLQTVKEHDAAIALFQQVIALKPEEKMQRELYYWMADSRKAQARYDEAAQLYLKSAFLLHKALDPWGQTARYQAAESLAKAGLVDDAYNLFQQLLQTTKEVDRRAVLQHEIEKLKLSQHNRAKGQVTSDEEQVSGNE